MPSYVTPKKNVAFIGYLGLTDQSDVKKLKENPTLAAGDVKVSTDGGAFANITTLPTVTPSGTSVKLSLSADEMNGDNIVVTFIDAAGAEWCDLLISIQTATSQIDDLSLASTIGTPAGASVSADIASIKSNTTSIVSTLASGVALTTAAYNAIADKILVYDWETITSPIANYSVLQALRFLRNKWSITNGTLFVKDELGTNNAWQRAVTTEARNPVNELGGDGSR